MEENQERERLFEDFSRVTYEEWKNAAVKLLKGVPFDRKMRTRTPEGITLKPIYRKEDLEKTEHRDTFPGFQRFVRQTDETGYLNQSWTISQEEKAPVPEVFNGELREDIGRGMTGINIVLDDTVKEGRIQKQAVYNGLTVRTFEDLKEALSAIKADQYPFFVNGGPSALNILAMIGAFFREKKWGLDALKGTIGADPIGYLTGTGKLPVEMEKASDLMSEVLSWSLSKAPNIRTILVDTVHYAHGGASAVEELAYAMSTAVQYISEMLERGHPIDSTASKITFSFSVGSNFFMEIAKLRAAKLLWANIVEAFGGSRESQKIVIHARTSPFTQTVYDPYVNMLRDTSQAFSAVLGGVDSLHVAPFDERTRQPGAFSKRIARNVQLILKKECHLDSPIDPVGGTWYIEKLTAEVAEAAWAKFQAIEGAGGFMAFYKQGGVQKDLEKTNQFRQKRLKTRRDVIVGNNMYPDLDETVLTEDKKQKNSISDRINHDMEAHLKKRNTEELAIDSGESGLIDRVMDAYSRGFDIEQVTEHLFSGKESVDPVNIHYASEPFEELREGSKAISKKTGQRPPIFFANFGKLAVHKPRTDFSRGFFEVGGFRTIDNNSFESVEKAVEEAVASPAKIVIICSSNKKYPEVVVPFVKALKEERDDVYILLAGKPGREEEKEYRASGLDDYIHIRSDIYEINKKLQSWVLEQEGEQA